MILFVLDGTATLRFCEEYIEGHKLRGEDFLLFLAGSYDQEIPSALRSRLASVPSFSEHEQELIDETGTRIANDWPFLNSVSRVVRYKDINLASLFAHGLDYYWIWVLKQALAVKKIIQVLHPKKVILGYGVDTKGPFYAPQESYYARIAREVCLLQRIPFEEMNRPVADSAYDSMLKNRNGFLEKTFSQIFNILSFSFRNVGNQRPVVTLRSSLRVGMPLLKSRSPFRWVYLSYETSPKTYWKLLRGGIGTLALLPNWSRELSEKWSGIWDELKEKIGSEKLFHFEGIPLLSVARERYRRVFSGEIPILISWIDQCYEILRQREINAVVLDEDVTFFQKALAAVGKRVGVPSIVVQHGVTGQARGYTPFTATRIAAWGEISGNQLIEWGVPSDRVVVTGFPGMSGSFFKKNDPRRREIKEKLGINPQYKVVFLPSNRLRAVEHGLLRVKPNKKESLELFGAAADAVKNIGDCCLLVKIHPGDKIQAFTDFLKERGEESASYIKVVNNFDLRDLLEITDVVVNFYSTVSIEAMVFDIPIVNVDLMGKKELIPYVSAGAVYEVTAKKDLESTVERALRNPGELSVNRKRFVERYCCHLDGKSTERVLQLIQDELKKWKRVEKMGVIVQARMTSERLPGKVLEKIEDKTVLEHLINRLLVVFKRESIVVATSKESSDDSIEKLARALRIKIFRGSLKDVLDRYYQAAKTFGMDPIVRVTGDAPLIEPAYLFDLIRLYQESDADYVSAKNPRDFPRGATAEILSFPALERAWREGKDPDDREHVTWYIRHRPEKFKILNLKPRLEWTGPSLRLTVDESKDLELLREVFARLYRRNPTFGLDEVFSLYESEPEIFEINRDVKPKIDFIEPLQTLEMRG